MSLSFAEQNRENAAQQVVETWLDIVDSGKYTQSWDMLSKLFQQKVSKAEWAAELTKLRSKVGKLKNRTLIGVRYVRNLPDAPEGEYVVVQYKSDFTRKAQMLETAVPMLDIDGKWRVAGYFIQNDLPE